MSSSKSLSPIRLRMRRRRGDGASHGPETRRRLHPAPASVVDEVHRDRAAARNALVFRMNLNQQSTARTWDWHKRLLQFLPPIVDCGVHYVDVMCQMTKAKPVKVHALALPSPMSENSRIWHAAGDLR